MDHIGIEKIRSVARTLIKAKDRKWGFLTVREFMQETELGRDQLLFVLNLFKESGIFNYSFLPFDDPKIKKSIFDDKDDITDPHGAIWFAPDMNKKPLPSLKKFLKGFNWERLAEIAKSDEACSEFLETVSYSPKIVYDPWASELQFGRDKIKVAPGNESAICEVVFSKSLGTFFKEIEITEKMEDASTTEYRVTYNAMNSINRKFEKITGISKLIKYRDGRIWASIDKSQ